MKISWGKADYHAKGEGPFDEASRPSDVEEQSAPLARPGRRLSPDWMDDAVEEYARNGGFDNLTGKGKPIEIKDSQTEDATLNRILANNQILPPWLALQHEIRDELGLLCNQYREQPESDNDARIRRLNAKIKKYNDMCPSPILQKPFVSRANLESQHSKWI